MASLPPAEVAYQEAHINEDKSPMLIAVCTVFTGLALLSLAMRLAQRASNKSRPEIDDYFAILAAVNLIGLNITACMIGHYGIGKHLLAVAQNPENFINIGKAELAFSVFYNTAMPAAKLAILALLARIFTLNYTWFRVGVWFWAVWTVLWWVASWFITFLECRPLSTSWGVPYQCRPKFVASVSAAVFNIISDVGILLLPQPHIWGLHVPLSKKITISLVFLLGIFATAVSIARIPLTRGANSSHSYDSTWSSTDALIFSVLEPTIAAICGNVTTSTKLIKAFGAKTGLSSLFSTIVGSMTSEKTAVNSSSGKSRSWKGVVSSKSGTQSEDWIRLQDKPLAKTSTRTAATEFDARHSAGSSSPPRPSGIDGRDEDIV